MSDTDRYDSPGVEHDPNPAERGRWASALVALLGLWLLVAALVFDLVPANFWNEILVGVGLAAIGGYNYYRRSDERLGSVAAAGLAALLGVWLVVSPYLIDVGVSGIEAATEIGFWNNVVVGLLAIVIGAYSAYEASDSGVGTTTRTG